MPLAFVRLPLAAGGSGRARARRPRRLGRTSGRIRQGAAGAGARGERARLVGKAPEQQGDDDRAPELRHDVEQAEAPVAQDGDRPGEAHARARVQPVRQRWGRGPPVSERLCGLPPLWAAGALQACGWMVFAQPVQGERRRAEEADKGGNTGGRTVRVDGVAQRVHDERKRAEEHDKRDYAGVEQLLRRQYVCQLRGRRSQVMGAARCCLGAQALAQALAARLASGERRVTRGQYAAAWSSGACAGLGGSARKQSGAGRSAPLHRAGQGGRQCGGGAPCYTAR